MVQNGESQWEGCSKCSQLYIPRAEQYVCDDCLPNWNLDVDRQTEADTRRGWIQPVMTGERMSPPSARGAGQVYNQLQQAEGYVRHQLEEGGG